MASISGPIVRPRAAIGLSPQLEGGPSCSSFQLSNLDGDGPAEVIFDYGRCEGGIPIFKITSAAGPIDRISFRVTYSEARVGIDHENGDGPFFLFSNAMDSYRNCLHDVCRSDKPQKIEARLMQYSQRYQKISLVYPGTSIKFSSIGFLPAREPTPIKNTFNCSDELLNSIWRDGVRTLDMCTVRQGETRPAWDVTSEGTKIYGGHWAPCRKGTAWTNKVTTFDVKIEKGGASWGVHMIANGLVFCLDAQARTLSAFEGLSNQSSLLPSVPRGSWPVSSTLDLSGWLSIRITAHGEFVDVVIENERVAQLSNVRIKSILTGDCINAGSIAFGGPEGWISFCRSLSVTAPDGQVLYENGMTTASAVFADFQVGTNPLACTIDGAKRDRACFGGDVYVMGRSIAYSTADFEAWRGSIRLLVSHQTHEGYLGNLCPIQAPEHEGEDEPPKYAFYSLTYALLLIVSVKDYWIHSGDQETIKFCYPKLKKLIQFTEKFTNQDGLIEAPAHLQMTWFPMGGPVIGASSGVNIAYYDALASMAEISRNDDAQSLYLSRAEALKDSIVKYLWNPDTGILRLGVSLPADGFCQDVNAYALTKGIVPPHGRSASSLSEFTGKVPPAFQGLGHWSGFGVSSPYATGFAVEALFSMSEGKSALSLTRRMWQIMSDPSSPNYSGAHWEAMKVDGSPFNHDVSLAHGWATWPVFLLPRYLVGLYPLEPGWKKVAIEPVFTELKFVECSVDTPAGKMHVSITFEEGGVTGTLSVLMPPGSESLTTLPKGWALQGSREICSTGHVCTQNFARLET